MVVDPTLHEGWQQASNAEVPQKNLDEHRHVLMIRDVGGDNFFDDHATAQPNDRKEYPDDHREHPGFASEQKGELYPLEKQRAILTVKHRRKVEVIFHRSSA